jgi:copper transport protein
MSLRRALVGLSAMLVGLLAVPFTPASPASAHAAFLRSDPQAGAVLAEAPAQVVLTFSEPVRVVGDKIHIFGPDGKQAETGEPQVDGAQVRIPVKPTAAKGSYLVSYRLISADSHPITGGIPFSIGAPSPNAPRADTAATAASDPVVTSLLATSRYLGYAGLCIVVGPALFLAALWPRRLSRRGPLRLIMVGVGLVVVSALAEQYLQAPYHAGTTIFRATVTDLRDVFNSQYGAAHLVRIGVVAALAVLLPLFVNRSDDEARAGWSDRVLVAILAVVGLATWPVSGHPVASSVPVLTTVADAAHLGAMAVWVGGLITLVGYLLRRVNARELAAILPVWSRWAMTAVMVLVVAGTAQALVAVGSIRGLYTTRYGQVLLVKIGILALVLTVAWYSRRLVNGPLREPDPAPVADEIGLVTVGSKTGKRKTVAAPPSPPQPVADDETGAARGRLRRSVLLELGGTAVVLALASVLVQTTPARAVLEEASRRTNSEYNNTLTSPLYSVQVQLEPKQTGANTIHLYAFTPTGGPLSVKEWKATAALPAQNIEAMELPMLPVDGNHAVAQAQLPAPGTWQLRFTLRTTETDAATVTAQVPIE